MRVAERCPAARISEPLEVVASEDGSATSGSVAGQAPIASSAVGRSRTRSCSRPTVQLVAESRDVGGTRGDPLRATRRDRRRRRPAWRVRGYGPGHGWPRGVRCDGAPAIQSMRRSGPTPALMRRSRSVWSLVVAALRSRKWAVASEQMHEPNLHVVLGAGPLGLAVARHLAGER